MADMQTIPIDNRLCDLCNSCVTDCDYVVTKSFVLTDWGVICIACWDGRLVHHREFLVEKVYIKSMKVEDPWVKRPLVFTTIKAGIE